MTENMQADDVQRRKPRVVRCCLNFYMKVPEDLRIVSDSFTEDDHKEFLRWIRPDDDVRYFPEFFRTELLRPQNGVKHFVTSERE